MTMSEPAVLSSAMLARKGAAVPTGYTPLRPYDIDAGKGAARFATENTGDPPPPATTYAAAAIGGPSSTAGRRARVSVRLDRERHLKLKLTAAHLQRTLQDVITDALDRYLEQLGPEVLRTDCACLGMKGGAMKCGAALRGGQPD